jgi:hypothetical protein
VKDIEGVFKVTLAQVWNATKFDDFKPSRNHNGIGKALHLLFKGAAFDD